MDKVEDGRPAFSGPTGAEPGTTWPGMSLRDYFAGQALAGALANAQLLVALVHVAKNDGRSRVRLTAEYSYEIADAMLLARKAGDQS